MSIAIGLIRRGLDALDDFMDERWAAVDFDDDSSWLVVAASIIVLTASLSALTILGMLGLEMVLNFAIDDGIDAGGSR